jgi:Zn-dependent protease with chaperone function
VRGDCRLERMAPVRANTPAEGYRLEGISARAFQHPADRAATAALGSIPYLEQVVRKLIELGYERALRQSYLGSSVRLSERQLGNVYREHALAYTTLDVAPVPDVYLTQYPTPNAIAIGSRRPIVVVQSELIALLDAPQRRAVFAHEAAHILADHQLYRTALYILVLMTRSARLPLPLAPVRSALLEWSRAAELSADRAAALVVRDPQTVCSTLMCLAGGAMVAELDLDAFMTQGLEYKESGGGLERLTRLLIDLGVTHPLPVRRAHELMEWVRSGDYDRIVAGEYMRREDPVDMRADGGDAVSYYTERMRDAFRDAGGSVASVGQQLAGWLRRASAAAGEDQAPPSADASAAKASATRTSAARASRTRTPGARASAAKSSRTKGSRGDAAGSKGSAAKTPPPRASGTKASGTKASGTKASGTKASGTKASGSGRPSRGPARGKPSRSTSTRNAGGASAEPGDGGPTRSKASGRAPKGEDGL